MTKVVIINDQHYGVRNDEEAFARQQAKFDKVLFEYIQKNDIKYLLHAGDLLDRRKYINFKTLKNTRVNFLEILDDIGCETHIIPGNHDQYFKNVTGVMGIEEVLRGYKNIHLHTKPVDLQIGNQSVMMVPWICEENEKECLEAIKDSPSRYCLAHLELFGFEMDKGNYCEHGMNARPFEKFDWVGSGHFHHRSTKKHIHYLGAAYQFTWADYGNPKGFTVLDLETGKHEHVNNPFEIFKVFNYDDTNIENIEAELQKDFSEYQDCHVKLNIVKKSNEYLYELIVSEINKANPIKLSIMDTELNLNENNVDIENAAVESTPKLISMYIDELKIENPAPVKKLMEKLYVEATTIEEIE